MSTTPSAFCRRRPPTAAWLLLAFSAALSTASPVFPAPAPTVAAASVAANAAARKPPGLTTELRRGPYLQRGSSTSMLIAWRTGLASDSKVFFGPSPDHLAQSAEAPEITYDHRVELQGLSPDTTYYYAVGSSAGVLFGDESTFFHTAPEPGSTRPLRLWVIGDSGRADINAQAVYGAFRTWNAGRPLDGWLMLGDNAYPSGTDRQYEAAVFDMYPEFLRQLCLWPIYGNHDGVVASAITQTGPYFEIFEPPTQGESGGLPSGTEAYYSFDLGNLHVAVLDSYQSSRAPNGAMAAWLDADLAATGAEWLVVAFHHPPYSKGSHDSDTEVELQEMRQNFGPIFESRGVDLVLSGHSHGYERSMLIDGHYGLSTSFGAPFIKNPGDGHLDGDGPYAKPAGVVPHEGTVYQVVGISSSYSEGGSLNHPAMIYNYRKLGSVLLEVAGSRLDSRVIDVSGREIDHFTIVKGADPCPQVAVVPAGATWRYRDDGADLGTAWRQEAYADGAWPSGPAELGYGDGDEATVIGYGPNPSAKYPTTYFRHSFTVADPAAVLALEARIRRDDAVALYLNGVPVVEDNFAHHVITWGAWARVAIGGADESTWHSWQLDPSLLHAGTNVLAAEVHQAGPTSTDLSFDLELRTRSCPAGRRTAR